jgi:hypothetical protein
VLVGGYGNSTVHADTWEWDGSTWTNWPGAGTPAIFEHAMSYDLARRRLVVFGGIATARDETWEWDGTTWTAVVVTPRPSGRNGHALAYEPAWQRTLLFGGEYGSLGDTWSYGPLLPASTSAFGAGCPGAAGTPVLASTAPVLGDPAFAMDLVGGAPLAPCAIALATATRPLPLGGCTVHVDGTIASRLFVTSTGGFASLKFAVPPQPTFRGMQLFGQAVVLDAASPIGLALTNGLRVVLGD